jgi:hypothetical protein
VPLLADDDPAPCEVSKQFFPLLHSCLFISINLTTDFVVCVLLFQLFNLLSFICESATAVAKICLYTLLLTIIWML